MKTKTTILSIAIIAILPFVANAEQTTVTSQTPAAVGANGTVNVAATGGPYQIATIGEHDDEHIATTAYVKGAYNDSIRAVNKLDSRIAYIESDYVDGSAWNDALQGVADDVLNQVSQMIENQIDGLADVYQQKIYNENDNAMGEHTLNADTFVNMLASNPNLVASDDSNVVTIGAVASGLLAQRVEIYTTWGTNNTTDVALKTVAPQN